MSRNIETVTITPEPYVDEQIIGYTCDLCGIKSKHPWDDSETYSGNYENIIVRREYGHSWPEGGNKSTELYDVCPKCWVDKIVPLFNCSPTETESDW